MSTPAKVTVTGAAGQIGYALLFRVASGQLLGPDRPVRLNLLEIPQAVKAAEGTAMELDDCAFPLLAGIDIHDDPDKAFDGTNFGLLVGARPRGPGMERADLLEANGGIFGPQGKAINAGAASDVERARRRQPGEHERADRPEQRARRARRALPRDDAPGSQPRDRAARQKTGSTVDDVTNMTIWGNHSTTQYPDLFHAKVKGQRAIELVDDQEWYENDYIPTVAKRGAAIIEARGASSAASAANAAIDHVLDWVGGTPDGDWVSMSVPVGRLLRRARGDHLLVPVHLLERRVLDRAGPRDRRLLAREDRRERNELVEEREAVAGLGLI